MFSQRNAPPRTTAGRLRPAAIIELDPRARTDLEHAPGRSEREPEPTTPPPADAAACGPAPARRRAVRASRRPVCATSSARRGTPRKRSSMAHVDLAKAEAGAIAGEVGKVAALGALGHRPRHLRRLPARHRGIAGLGEWLLGSMGWGVLHGVLLFLSVAMAAVLIALGYRRPAYRRGAARLDRRRRSWSASSSVSTCRTSSMPRSATRPAWRSTRGSGRSSSG